jgi:microcystin-dependent protein
MTLWKWSTDPATNGSADSTCPFPEGMAPSQVNDSARGIMAAAAKYRDDISGKIVTGGTSTAYTITSNQGFDTLAHLDGAMIAFVPHTTSGAAPTLNVDGLGAKPLRGQSGTDLLLGVLLEDTPYVAFYNNTAGEFVLHSYFVNPGEIPIGCGMEYWGSTVPSSNFVFPYGQAISRTDYPICFARLGTAHGSGDGSTTFNLPDKRGRVSAALDNMGGTSAGRLTPPASGGVSDSTVIGAAGGAKDHTLTIPQIAAHSHANTLSDPGHGHTVPFVVTSSSGGSGGSNFTMGSGNQTTNIATTGITITNASTGGGGAHNNVQPTIMCNYILRVK